MYLLIFDQPMHLSHSQALNSGLTQRSHSLSTFNNRSQDLIRRMEHTEEVLPNNVEGILTGYSIPELSSTLGQLLIESPDSIAFNVERKYLMLWEAQYRKMEPYSMGPNFHVDTNEHNLPAVW